MLPPLLSRILPCCRVASPPCWIGQVEYRDYGGGVGISAGAGRGERSVRGGHDGEKGDGRVVSMSMVVSFKVLDEYVPLFFSSVIVLLLNAYSQNNMLVRE